MKKVIPFLLIISFFIISCSDNKKEKNIVKKVAKGDYCYGGNLKVNENGTYHTLYPYNIIDITSLRIASQIYEGLVKYDMKDLSIIPSIAKSWTIDSTGKTYTFILKDSVKFHDDPCFSDNIGRLVTSEDVVYSFKLLCTYSKSNQYFKNTFSGRVLGADEYYEASKNGVPNFDIKGIKAIDSKTVQITLSQPSSTFIYAMAQPGTFIVPKEGVEKYGEELKIGTGPYKMANNLNKDTLILTKNYNYYEFDSLGNQLPYIDSITITFINSKDEEFELFKKEQLDIITNINSESFNQIIQENIADFNSKNPKYVSDRKTDMTVYYLLFNMQNKLLLNKDLRLALIYAIDKQKIIKQILKSEDIEDVILGITPKNTFNNYDSLKTLTGLNYDLVKARECLKKAGYSDVNKLPKIKLLINNRENVNTIIAQSIQTQLLNNLGIKIEYENIPIKEQLQNAQYGKFDMLLTTWTADYPSPESFLWLFYGKNNPKLEKDPSFPNFGRYINNDYDKLYEEGKKSLKTKESYLKFAQAEQILINDAPFSAIWYPENNRIYYSKVKGFYFNALKYVDYSKVYIKKYFEEKSN